MARTLVLASTSPRRHALLKQADIPFVTLDPLVEESSICAEPGGRVAELAVQKALAGALKRPEDWILAADTLVFQQGSFFPKPTGPGDARRMLQRLSGEKHQVWTGVALKCPGISVLTLADSAEVSFEEIPEKWLNSYLSGTEWKDKAGAYGIQGAVGRFATVLRGEEQTVVGLNIPSVLSLLREARACLGGD